MTKVYVVAAPWDSYSIGCLSVYDSRAKAEKAKKEYNDTRSVHSANAFIQEEIIQ